MPVLDGNMDEYSDARSLAASIKGGSKKQAAGQQNNLSDFLDQVLDTVEPDGSLEMDKNVLSGLIKGGGKGLNKEAAGSKNERYSSASRPDSSAFQPIGINIGSPPSHPASLGMISPSPLLMPGYFGGTVRIRMD